MKINEQYHNLNLLENVTYEFLGRDGETHEETEPILVEHMMDVYVNERLTMKLVCIPQHLAELVLGRLFTEGIISSADDVDQIYICEFGKRARVILSKINPGSLMRKMKIMLLLLRPAAPEIVFLMIILSQISQ
mgnify:CR=1 FL=1